MDFSHPARPALPTIPQAFVAVPLCWANRAGIRGHECWRLREGNFDQGGVLPLAEHDADGVVFPLPSWRMQDHYNLVLLAHRQRAFSMNDGSTRALLPATIASKPGMKPDFR